LHPHDTTKIMTIVKSHLDDIRWQILSELNKAKFSIFVASAYFTDYDLASKLGEKAERGLSVDLIISNSKINDSSKAIIQSLRDKGVNIYKNGASDFRQGAVMHNKFCIIDYETVITGSYNWTRQAAINEENIVIFKDTRQADIFLQKFYTLRKDGGLFSFFNNEIEINLSLDRNIIEHGEEVKLSWKVVNADLVSIDPIGSVGDEGEFQLKITDDTLVIIEAENDSTGKKKTKSVLVRMVREPVIVFDISANSIIRTQTAQLTWSVENAEIIKIEPAIGSVEANGSRTINPFESTTYTITAVGLTESTTREKVVTLNVYPTPVLEKLQIPTPSNIKLEATFENSKVIVPSALNIGTIEKFSFDVPRIRGLNSEFIPNRLTVHDLENALQVPTKSLYGSLGESENKLKSLILESLERLSRTNLKMIDLIKSFRRKHE
jgi:hypothetical protein